MTTTVAPVADSWANSDAATKNYGSDTTLRVDDSPVRHVYLRFDLQSLSGSVARATLRLYSSDESTRGYQAWSTSGDWSESSLTWLNAPPAGTLLGESGSFEANTWTSVDVSRMVTGAGVYNIELTTISPNSKHFASREAGANAPQLVVETNAASSPSSTTAPSSTLMGF